MASKRRVPADEDRARLGYGMDAEILRRALGSSSLARPTRRQKLTAVCQRYGAAAATRALALAERAGVRGRVRCPVCDWSGAEFRPLALGGWLQRNAICPSCGSVQRQRLVALVISRLDKSTGGPTVWVAPERCLERLVHETFGALVTIDLEMPDVDITADVESLPLPTRSIAAAVSSDVLEHVTDDHRALVELHRVLRDNGVAVLHVPVLWTETVEYGFAHPLEWGHRRGYGPDIVDRFGKAGFDVETIRATQWSRAEVRRRGLLDWDVVFVLRKAA